MPTVRARIIRETRVSDFLIGLCLHLRKELFSEQALLKFLQRLEAHYPSAKGCFDLEEWHGHLFSMPVNRAMTVLLHGVLRLEHEGGVCRYRRAAHEKLAAALAKRNPDLLAHDDILRELARDFDAFLDDLQAAP